MQLMSPYRAARIGLSLLTVLAIVAQPCAAADKPLPMFKRAGSGFACAVPRELGDEALKSGIDMEILCLRIGPLHIGMKRSDAEGILGQPAVQQQTAYVYPLKVANGLAVTYAVLTYSISTGDVFSIQVTGEPWPANWDFNGIHLGETASAVHEELGEPHSKRSGPDIEGSL